MKIDLPSIPEQQKVVYEASTKAAIQILRDNLKAPKIEGQTAIDESKYSNRHLLREHEGYEAPDPDIVRAYFTHFQSHFDEYNTDKKLAHLLGLSSDRRVREFKEGSRKVPYGVWRKFLVLTGRASQDVLPVLAFIG